MRARERMPAWEGLRRRAVIALLFGFALPGHAQTLESAAVGTLQSVRDCELRYRIHPAATPGRGPVVLIAHGFLRRGEYMAGWADAIARAGLTAVTVDLCASAAANGRHADNGADLVALRRKLGIEAAVYVGVSAGGLAAMIAASLDPDATRGVLAARPDQCRRPGAKRCGPRARAGRGAGRETADLQRVAQHRSGARDASAMRRSCASTALRTAISNGRPTRSAASRASRPAATSGIVAPKHASATSGFRSSTRSQPTRPTRCRGGRAKSAKHLDAALAHAAV